MIPAEWRRRAKRCGYTRSWCIKLNKRNLVQRQNGKDMDVISTAYIRGKLCLIVLSYGNHYLTFVECNS